MSIGNKPPATPAAGGIGNRGIVRADGRAPGDLRKTEITLGVQKWAEGSCIIRFGDTQLLCAATIEDRVPPHLRGKGTGWVTATYEMLPRATAERSERESAKGRVGGRTHEIQRLIGRSLRGVVDFAALGERTIYLDCDVLTADGGTRCASITGAFVALDLAARHLVAEGKLVRTPLTGTVAAVSCGIVDGTPLLDLDYSEDSTAEVDANVVMTGDGGLVEVQATAERTPLQRAHLDELLVLAAAGIEELRSVQAAAVESAAAAPSPTP